MAQQLQLRHSTQVVMTHQCIRSRHQQVVVVVVLMVRIHYRNSYSQNLQDIKSNNRSNSTRNNSNKSSELSTLVSHLKVVVNHLSYPSNNRTAPLNTQLNAKSLANSSTTLESNNPSNRNSNFSNSLRSNRIKAPNTCSRCRSPHLCLKHNNINSTLARKRTSLHLTSSDRVAMAHQP